MKEILVSSFLKANLWIVLLVMSRYMKVQIEPIIMDELHNVLIPAR